MPITKKYKKIVIGNWKENPSTHEAAKNIVKNIKRVASQVTKTITVLCPPSVFLSDLGKGEQPYSKGAQDVSVFEGGSHTGEVSAEMLKDSGVEYTIVGHSERRKMGETDAMVASKIVALHFARVTAVMCVGEDNRDSGGQYLDILKNQIKHSLAGVEKKNLSHLIVAYEPVWAIGATQAMSPADVHETAIFIKKTLADLFGHDYVTKIPILYGGSVNFRNAGEIVGEGHVDGLLVGRESINPEGFNEILKVVDTI